MGLWNTLSNWITDATTGSFISQDEIDTARQVEAGQSQQAARQFDDGVIDWEEYHQLDADIHAAGNYLEAERNRPAPDMPTLIPWWWWIVLAAGLFFYFGGGILLAAKPKKSTP